MASAWRKGKGKESWAKGKCKRVCNKGMQLGQNGVGIDCCLGGGHSLGECTLVGKAWASESSMGKEGKKGDDYKCGT